MLRKKKKSIFFFVCKDTSLFRSISFAMMEHITVPFNLIKIITRKWPKSKFKREQKISLNKLKMLS